MEENNVESNVNEEHKIEAKASERSEDKIIEERKKKALSFLKAKKSWIFILILIGLMIFSVWLRTLPMHVRAETGHPGLWDVTTNSWTLGPDLDPFLFLRWAKDIVSHGSLPLYDTMRYVPLGFDTKGELLGLTYMIVLFHKTLLLMGMTDSVEYSAVLFPAVLFSITVLVFFLLVRKMFANTLGKNKSNIIALIASFFLIIIPALLPRTVAGIPEKESPGFLFMFLTFYLFISAWKAKKITAEILLGLLAGLSTAAMAYVWGGFIYIFLTIGIALFVALIMGQMNFNKLIVSIVWIFSSFLLMSLLSTRYSFNILLNSTTMLIPLAVIALAAIYLVIFETRLKKYFENSMLLKLPKPIAAIVVSLVFGLIVYLLLAIVGIIPFTFITDKIMDVTRPLITPITSRLGVTVAENRQPFFGEWAASFGPNFGGKIPLFFWLFFIGSIYLYSTIMKVLSKRGRIVATTGYTVFLFAIIFSRYSASSIFNGTNFLSLSFYVFGVLCLLGSFGYYYYKYFKHNEFEKLQKIDFGLILLFSLFFLSIISARGSVRTIMLLAPPAAIIVGFFIVQLHKNIKEKAEEQKQNSLYYWIIFGFVLLIILATVWTPNSSGFRKVVGPGFLQITVSQSNSYIPSSYTQQWQLAMAWVRENTKKDAVFGHWWDYGYWVQTLGERATVLDGGNAISYWNHLMGRHGLTSPSNSDALEFLYSHNTTHFLIDSTDIGKYGAFSSIGGNENYDRTSFIQTLYLDKQQTKENRNSTSFVYGIPNSILPLDSDIIYEDNGTKIFLPKEKAGLIGIIIERDALGKVVSQPIGVFGHQNGQQYRISFRYAYASGNFTDFGSGLESGIFLYSSLIPSSQGYSIDKDANLIYLSSRTVKSQLARLYFYKEETNFKLVHSEDDFVVSSLKNQKIIGEDDDFIQYYGFRGPIRIWEIQYPSNMTVNKAYLQTEYPDLRLAMAL